MRFYKDSLGQPEVLFRIQMEFESCPVGVRSIQQRQFGLAVPGFAPFYEVLG
jgi:hypothetical protein